MGRRRIVIGLGRASTEEQALGWTEAFQRAQIEEWIARQPELVGRPFEFYFDYVSGTVPLRDRPALTEVLERCQKGEVGDVVVFRLDRLARRVSLTLQIIEKIAAGGANFHSVNEQIDTSTIHGRFFLHLLASLAEMEHATITERIIHGVQQRAREGYYPTRPPSCYSFASKSNGGKSEVMLLPQNEPEVQRWKQVAHLYIGGIPLKAACEAVGLNYHTVYSRFKPDNIWVLAGKVPVRDGKTFNPATGKYTEGTKVWVSGKHPAILTEDECQAIIRRMTRYRRPGRRSSRSLFVELVRCGVCGRRMYVRYDRASRRQLACDGDNHNSRRSLQRSERKIQNAVIYGLDLFLRSQEFRAVLNDFTAAEYTEAQKATEKELVRIGKARQSLSRRMTTILDARSDGVISPQQFSDAMRKIEADREALDRAEQQAKARVEETKTAVKRWGELKKLVLTTPVTELWAEMTEFQRRELLHAWLNCITIFPDYVVLHVHDLPAYRVFFNETAKQNEAKKLERETGSPISTSHISRFIVAEKEVIK